MCVLTVPMGSMPTLMQLTSSYLPIDNLNGVFAVIHLVCVCVYIVVFSTIKLHFFKCNKCFINIS